MGLGGGLSVTSQKYVGLKWKCTLVIEKIIDSLSERFLPFFVRHYFRAAGNPVSPIAAKEKRRTSLKWTAAVGDSLSAWEYNTQSKEKVTALDPTV